MHCEVRKVHQYTTRTPTQQQQLTAAAISSCTTATSSSRQYDAVRNRLPLPDLNFYKCILTSFLQVKIQVHLHTYRLYVPSVESLHKRHAHNSTSLLSLHTCISDERSLLERSTAIIRETHVFWLWLPPGQWLLPFRKILQGLVGNECIDRLDRPQSGKHPNEAERPIWINCLLHLLVFQGPIWINYIRLANARIRFWS